MHFQRFPCTSWNFLSCFSCCTFRSSNCARLKNIALGQLNVKTAGYLPKVLRTAFQKCKRWRSLHADYVISNSDQTNCTESYVRKALDLLNLKFSRVLKLCKKGADNHCKKHFSAGKSYILICLIWLLFSAFLHNFSSFEQIKRIII